MTSGVAEEYWPDKAGLEHSDTVTDFEMPAGTFFDIAVVHMLTSSTIDRLRELYPRDPWRLADSAPTSSSRPAARIPASWRTTGSAARLSSAPLFAWPSPNHAPLRDDHAATGRPTQRLRNPTDGRSTQCSERRRLRLSDQWRNHPPRRHGPARLSWDSRRRCRGLLEAALQHVAAFQEIRRRGDSPCVSRPRIGSLCRVRPRRGSPCPLHRYIFD